MTEGLRMMELISGVARRLDELRLLAPEDESGHYLAEAPTLALHPIGRGGASSTWRMTLPLRPVTDRLEGVLSFVTFDLRLDARPTGFTVQAGHTYQDGLRRPAKHAGRAEERRTLHHASDLPDLEHAVHAGLCDLADDLTSRSAREWLAGAPARSRRRMARLAGPGGNLRVERELLEGGAEVFYVSPSDAGLSDLLDVPDAVALQARTETLRTQRHEGWSAALAALDCWPAWWHLRPQELHPALKDRLLSARQDRYDRAAPKERLRTWQGRPQ